MHSQRAIARRYAVQLAPGGASKPTVQRAVLARSLDWRHSAAGGSASMVSDPDQHVRATERRRDPQIPTPMPTD